MKLLFKYFVFLFLLSSFASAQMPEIQFENLTTYDGLADDDRIFDILQDKQGFIWFATSNGLSRYDGYSFKTYYHVPSDSTTISSNNIRCIFEDAKDRLWVGSGDGLNLYDALTETFLHFKNDPDDNTSLISNSVLYIIGDDNGLWIGTSNRGLDRFDFQTQKFHHYKNDPNDNHSLSSNRIKRLFIDRDSNLWIGAGTFLNWQEDPGGLNKFDSESKKFKRYFLSDKSSSIPDNNISEIAEDNKGQLYVGTSNSMLYLYNREKDSFQPLREESNKYPFAPKGKGLANIRPGVNGIHQDEQGYLWISTFSGGLNRFDLSNNSLQHYPNPLNEQKYLASKNIFCLYEDRQGTMWISAFKHGVYKIIPSENLFNRFAKHKELSKIVSREETRAFLEDSFGNYWIGTNNKVIRFNKQSNSAEIFNKFLNLNIQYVDIFYEDESKNLWIGGSGIGLNKFNLTTSELKTYLPNPDIDGSIPFWGSNALARQNDSIMWIGDDSYGGLAKFNIHSEKFKLYTRDPEDSNSLSNNRIWEIFVDSMSDLWIGTENGLNKYIEKSNNFERYLNGIEINAIIEDKNRNLWFGSATNGLVFYSRRINEFSFYGKEEGLPSNTIFSLVEDNVGDIWIGSTSGLIRLELESMRFATFNREDGIISQPGRWADGAYKTKNGQILFGGNNGITAFDPNDFITNTSPPNIEIISLSIFDKPYKEKGKIDSVIVLDYDENDISIEYVGLHFKDPSQNLYSVKLEPYENVWSKPGTSRKVRYTSLPPGKYNFKVKASNSDGIWNEKGKSLVIIISPPLWATWWAYSSYLILAFGLLYSIRRFELNRQRKNAAIKESELRAESAELQAKAAEAQSRVIQAENERKTKELEEARQLQLSMLPKEIPQLPNLDIAVYMKTATEVGGDYYDFHLHLDETLTVVLGDATGHGMQSGMMVSIMKSLFMSDRSNKDLKPFFQKSNLAIKDMHLGRLLMALTCVQFNGNKIRIANAGMPSTLVYREKMNIVEEISINNLPLGGIKEFKYDIIEVMINSGDTILLLSDGFPELSNKKGELLGYQKVNSYFAETAKESPDKIVDYLNEKGLEWSEGKENDDDITFVVIKVK